MAKKDKHDAETGESDLEVELDIDYAESNENSRSSQFEWATLIDALTEQFFERRKRKFVAETNTASSKRVKSAADKLIIPNKAYEDLPEFAHLPRIKRKKCSEVMLQSLTFVRYDLFKTIKLLAKTYCESNKIFPNVQAAPEGDPVLYGYEIVAAARQIEIALSDSDLKTMLAHFRESVPEQITHNNNLMITLNSAARLSRLRVALEDSTVRRSSKSTKTEKSDSIFHKPIASTVITWESWCSLYDDLNLRVLKDGLVW